ncbi:MAG: endolytic transglycosylase MltG, partial [Patescibacteria group bacterium]
NSLEELTVSLNKDNVLRTPIVFKWFIRFLGGETKVKAGDYLFTESIALPRVALRMVLGEFNLTPTKITLPEGSSRKEMVAVFAKNLPNFDKEKFLLESASDEGYLFPDTYLFFPNASTEEIISTLRENFSAKIETLRDDIRKTKKTLREIIIMASIVEKEAHTMEDRKIIAGILWKRVQIGMPLQVDAPFYYAIGKGTYNLTQKDLKTDSPYNTYTRTGLPAGPIGNPGIDSIFAAIYPKTSPYLYYLSDREGNVYYSATFDKHKKNKVLYIN